MSEKPLSHAQICAECREICREDKVEPKCGECWVKEFNDLEAERDELAQALKMIDELRVQNFDRALSAESEVKTLKELMIRNNQARIEAIDHYRARLAKAKSDVINLRDYLYEELPTGDIMPLI